MKRKFDDSSYIRKKGLKFFKSENNCKESIISSKGISESRHCTTKELKNENDKYGPRRSSRKATIERRVWAEPRKDKNKLLHKESINKKGLSKKNLYKSGNFSKQILVMQKKNLLKNKYKVSINKCQKKSTNRSSTYLNVKTHLDKAKLVDNFAVPIDHCSLYTVENIEDNLIIDDDIGMSSLQSVVVDEVVDDDITNSSFVSVSSIPTKENIVEHLNSKHETGVINSTSYGYNKDENTVNISISKNKSSSNSDTGRKFTLGALCEVAHTILGTDNNCLQPDIKPSAKMHKIFPLNDTDEATHYQHEIVDREGYLNQNIEQPQSIKSVKYKLNSSDVGSSSKLNQHLPCEIHEQDQIIETDHVSLSDALAKLVDSDDSRDGVHAETVTIHPVINYRTLENSEIKNKIKLNDVVLNEFDNMQSDHTIVEEKSMDKFVNEQPASELVPSLIFKSKSSTVRDQVVRSMKHIKLKECNNEWNSSETTDESNCSSSSQSSNEEDLPFYIKQPPPALIRVPLRPPVIKTPLQCSECPMRFCTVRSLLWHFGTHENSSEGYKPITNLLEDLLVSWDKPHIPLLFNGKMKVDLEEKNYKCGSLNKPILDISSTNGDFILKVPIPRSNLIKKFESSATSDEESLIETRPASPGRSNSPPASGLPTFNNKINRKNFIDVEDIRLLAQSRKALNVGHHHNTNAVSISDISSFSSTDMLKIRKPNVTFSKLGKKSTLNSSVTIVPIDKLDYLKERSSSSEIIAAYKERETKSQIVEKDDLVMINDNLALRILSSNSKSFTVNEEFNAKDARFSRISSDCLTIFPQCKSIELGSNTKTFEGPIPDILTIVPQKNQSKSSEFNKEMQLPELVTAAGKMCADPSQIVKLVLISSKALNDGIDNENNLNDEIAASSSDLEYCSDESDDDDGGMVIDFKDDLEDASMDPLSLCAVTMEEADTHSGNRVCLSSEVDGAASNKIDTSKKPNKVDDEKYQRRKYVCQYCQKRFGWSTDLKRHVILHTGERPFKCKWCPITFTRKFLLQNHMKKLHTEVCKWSDLWE